jgi:hypothetical protein
VKTFRVHSSILVGRKRKQNVKGTDNMVIKTAKANYIQHIITSSNNTSKVLWKFVNRKRCPLNNTLTSWK